MKKAIVLIIFAMIGFSAFADNEHDVLYTGGVYGWAFELDEYSDGNNVRLRLCMTDNDKKIPTYYFIWSKWFTSLSEYRKSVKECKDFFNYTMNYFDINHTQSVCNGTPSCKLLTNEVA